MASLVSSARAAPERPPQSSCTPSSTASCIRYIAAVSVVSVMVCGIVMAHVDVCYLERYNGGGLR